MNKTQQHTNNRLIGLVIAALAAGYTFRFEIAPSLNQSPPPDQPSLAPSLEVEYERMEVGMELAEVRSILQQSGTEISSTETTETFIWCSPDIRCSSDLALITATFKDGKLSEKSQNL